MSEIANEKVLDQISDGDKAFKNQLIEIIKSEFPNEKKEYIENLNQKDYEKSADLVHKIKHKISILGLKEGYEIAVKHENLLRENNLKLCEVFLETLHKIDVFLLKK